MQADTAKIGGIGIGPDLGRLNVGILTGFLLLKNEQKRWAAIYHHPPCPVNLGVSIRKNIEVFCSSCVAILIHLPPQNSQHLPHTLPLVLLLIPPIPGQIAVICSHVHSFGPVWDYIWENCGAKVERRLPPQFFQRQLQTILDVVDAVLRALLTAIVQLGTLPAQEAPALEVQESDTLSTAGT